jgi:hypothetical protein
LKFSDGEERQDSGARQLGASVSTVSPDFAHPRVKVTNELISLLIALAAAAIWATVPLTIRLFTTMKRRSGVYFYAILITTWGITVRQIGVLTLWFIFTPNVPWVVRRILVEAGSIAMVSGFSVVLVSVPNFFSIIFPNLLLQYSRLSLIVLNRKIRRAVFCMILFNGIVWHTTVITNNAGIRYLKNRGRTDRKPIIL